MTRSIFYRVKDPAGPWQRAAGTVPFTVSGLVNDTVYEVDAGDGALTAVTPTAAYDEPAVVADGSAFLTGAGRIPDASSFLLFASYTATSTSRKSLLSFNGTNGALYSWDGLAPRFTAYTDSGFLLLSAPGHASGTRLHVLTRGYQSGGDIALDLSVWDSVSASWAPPLSTATTGTTIQFDTGTTEDFRVFERSNTTSHGFIGSAFRAALWTGVAPDVGDAAVQDLFVDGGSTIDPAVAVSAYGTPFFDVYGPAARLNAGTNGGSGGDFAVTGAFVDG